MKWQAVVDRFEGEIAVLQCFDPDHNSQKRYYTVEMPRVLLPQELKEGDYLTANWQIDPEGTKSARERVTSILERLANRNQK